MTTLLSCGNFRKSNRSDLTEPSFFLQRKVRSRKDSPYVAISQNQESKGFLDAAYADYL